jgi:alpha/beta superfamily hydrolase
VVSLRVAARDARVAAVFALGFPLARFGDAETIAAPKQPRLFVQGQHDQFGPGEKVRELVEPLPPPRAMVVVAGADHFFTDRLDELQDAVASWARTRPWEL